MRFIKQQVGVRLVLRSCQKNGEAKSIKGSHLRFYICKQPNEKCLQQWIREYMHGRGESIVYIRHYCINSSQRRVSIFLFNVTQSLLNWVGLNQSGKLLNAPLQGVWPAQLQLIFKASNIISLHKHQPSDDFRQFNEFLKGKQPGKASSNSSVTEYWLELKQACVEALTQWGILFGGTQIGYALRICLEVS